MGEEINEPEIIIIIPARDMEGLTSIKFEHVQKDGIRRGGYKLVYKKWWEIWKK